MATDIARRNSKPHATPERQVEEYLVKRVKSLGGIARKLTCPDAAGMPDRMVILKGQICFIELKRPKGGRLSDTQKWRIQELKQQEMKTYVLKNKEEIDQLIECLKRRELPDEI